MQKKKNFNKSYTFKFLRVKTSENKKMPGTNQSNDLGI